MACCVYCTILQGSASHATAHDRPAELSQLMQTLRQLRPPLTTETERNGTRENGETTTGTESRETDVDMEGKEAEEEVELAAMEARLKLYIDERFEQLERRLEKKIEEMFSNQLQHCKVLDSRPLHIVQDEDLD